ncbi:MAG: class II aldolase/adducin family protein [Acetivibrionales bacterium]|jgi:ribulose-5-phosphate 4-epimerase/fuculose-1-phosphate aldolase
MYTYEQCVEQIIKYSKLSYARGLVTAAGGNVSMRCGNNIIVTASGISLRDTAPENLVTCSMDGKTLACGIPGLKYSKETLLHLKIYNAKPEVNCIIHVHPPYSTGYSVAGHTVPMVTASAQMKVGYLPVVGHFNPGTEELANEIEKAVLAADDVVKCILMKDHGIIAYAAAMSDCFDIAELVEDTARISYIADTVMASRGKGNS